MPYQFRGKIGDTVLKNTLTNCSICGRDIIYTGPEFGWDHIRGRADHEAIPVRLGKLTEETKKALATLSELALAAEWGRLVGGYGFCPICSGRKIFGHDPECLYTLARAAGLLQQEEIK